MAELCDIRQGTKLFVLSFSLLNFHEVEATTRLCGKNLSQTDPMVLSLECCSAKTQRVVQSKACADIIFVRSWTLEILSLFDQFLVMMN